MKYTPEQIAEAEEKYMKMSVENRAAHTFMVAMLLLDKLETEDQRRDMVSAGMNFLRGIVLREFLMLLTEQGKLIQLPDAKGIEECLIKLMQNTASLMLQVYANESKTTPHFLTLCEMFPAEFLVRSKKAQI